MTKREKRLQDLRRKINRMERDRELGIKLLVKAVTALPALRKQEARLSAGWHPKPTITDEMVRIELLPGLMAVEQKPDPLAAWPVPPPADYRARQEDIPTFLDRTGGKDKDAKARAEIKAAQAEEKKRKVGRRIAKLKIGQETKHAELTGQRRKMPLAGKEALAAIRNGS